MNEYKVVPVAWRSNNPEAIKAGQKYSDADNSTYFWSVLNHGQKWPEDVNLLYSHADYRALEERYETLWEVQALTTQKLNEVREELAALRGKVGELFQADKEFDALYSIRYMFVSHEAKRRQDALDELDDSLL